MAPWPGAKLIAAIFRDQLGLPPGDPPEFADRDIDVVIQHRLGPLAWKLFGDRAPAAAARRLAASYLVAQQGAARAEALAGELASLLDVPFVVLKGVPLGRWLYGDPALRPSVDVDIFVEPRRLARARASLERAGFAGERPRVGTIALAFRRAGTPEVDVHFELWGDGLDPRDPSDAACLLAAHYVHDHGYRLLPLLDALLAAKRVGRAGSPPDLSSEALPIHSAFPGTAKEEAFPTVGVSVGTAKGGLSPVAFSRIDVSVGTAKGGPLLPLIERDACRWLGIGEMKPAPVAWAWLDRYWARVAPHERTWERDPGGREYLFNLYTACLLRPRSAMATLAGAIWPREPSGRWRGRLGWRLARWGGLLRGIAPSSR